LHRGCAHAEYQFVVVNIALFASDGGTCGDRVPGPVDGNNLLICPDFESEPIEQLFWALKGEIVFFFDQSTDEIWQATVGKGDVAGPLKNSDMGPGVEATETGRRRHPTGDAADDHDTACSNIVRVAHGLNGHDNPDMIDSYGLLSVSGALQNEAGHVHRARIPGTSRDRLCAIGRTRNASTYLRLLSAWPCLIDRIGSNCPFPTRRIGSADVDES
jgi:hypothetical protein